MTRAVSHDVGAVMVHLLSFGNRRKRYDALTKSVTGQYASQTGGFLSVN